MEKELYKVIEEAQGGDNESTMLIIEKFDLLIKKYSNKLNYDGADSDLIINLIEIVKKIPIYGNENMKKEECIVGYIVNSLKYKYIKLSKKHDTIYNSEIELNEDIVGNGLDNRIEDCIIINRELNKLSDKQKYILSKIFIYGYTESEIARELKISRQAVNKTKKKALENLKKYLIA